VRARALAATLVGLLYFPLLAGVALVAVEMALVRALCGLYGIAYERERDRAFFASLLARCWRS